MSVQGKHRLQIWSTHQHPLKHTLNDFAYTNNALPGVNNLQQTIDWMVAVFYPNTKDAVAVYADLPATGNTINDYRVVIDDGDGKAASYRWEQREGEAVASWHKVYDMDWGQDSILSAFMDITQELFVFKKGKMDTDSSGAALTGTQAGQHVYGGTNAGSNLTLHANSGDGVGANTGFVQLDDNVRPVTDNLYSIGTLANRFLNMYLSGLLNVGNLTLSGDDITSSTGVVNFDDDDIQTTGDITGTQINALLAQLGDLNIQDNELTSDSNVISMLAQTITGLVDIITSEVTVGTVTDNLTLTANAVRALYNASSGKHNFNNQDIENVDGLTTTTADIGSGDFANFTFSANDITNPNTVTVTSPSVVFSGDTSADNTSAGTVTGSVEGSFGNYKFDATKAQTISTNSNFNISPNGTGKVVAEKAVQPVSDNSLDLGATALRWKDIYVGSSIKDGTNTLSAATLMALRDVTVGAAAGMGVFWDGTKFITSYADLEVDHPSISNLTVGDSGHTQFAMLAGRAGGQVVQGGTAASENLELESTSNATKGNVIFKDTLIPKVTSTLDIGKATNKVLDVYASGQNFGLREENTTTANNFSLASIGRPYFNTTSNQSYRDAGDHAKYPLYSDEYTETAAGASQTLPHDIRMVANLTGALTSISNISVNSGIKGNRVKVLINRTGSVVSVLNSANILTGTGADLSVANDAAIMLVYNGTAWQVVGGTGSESGSGGGVVNFIANGNADDASASIFVPYTNIASSRPTTGTGILPPPIVTTSLTSTTPLSGTKSFLLTKPASNVQGQGWSATFSVDLGYRAKSSKISVDYIVNSGTFVAGSPGVDSDVIWYLYDITNSLLIEPSNIKMLSNSSTLSDKFEATFQTSATGSSYRLIAHVATASTLAYELKVDNISAAPSQYVYAPVKSDPVSISATSAWTTNTTTTCKVERDGSFAWVEWNVALTGAPNATTLTLNLPPGLSIDTSKLTNTGSSFYISGSANANRGASGTTIFPLYQSTTQVYIAYTSNTTTWAQGLVSNTAPVTWSSGDNITAKVRVPIVGWTSNAQVSDGFEARDLTFSGTQSSQAVTANVTNIAFTASKDSASSWDGTQYTVKSAGDYLMTASAAMSGAGTLGCYKNGTFFAHMSAAGGGGQHSAGATIYPNLVAGDTISLRCSSSITITSGNIAITKNQAPTTISATEEISLRYTSTSGQTIPLNTAATYIYGIRDYDSHGAYNLTTGEFKPPMTGRYQIRASIRGTYSALAHDLFIGIYKNGVAYSESFKTTSAGSGNSAYHIDTINLLSTDIVTIKVYQSGAAAAASVNALANSLAIERVK
jgi:hypothetical protein